MSRKNLILLHRGPRYEQDFREIAQKVVALDPSIMVAPVYAGSNATIPDREWEFPTLTVALCEVFKLPIKRGPVLRNVRIDKFRQLEIMREHGINTPYALPFQFGMTLDPILFGEHVILKPLDPRLGSYGQGIRVLRRARAEKTIPADFPPDHPIHHTKKGYIVQRLVYTGEYARTYRVATFLGAPLYGATYTASARSPLLVVSDAELEAGNFTQKEDRSIAIEIPPEFVDQARAVAAAFDQIPLLGIDFVKDTRTGQTFVLEVNAGGNTWHFSSQVWEQRHRENPHYLTQMKTQFSAFDAAARALVDCVNRLAA